MEMCKKPFRRLTAITLGVLLSLTAVVSAFAAQGTTYKIDEIDGMQLTVGTEMMAVTRNTDSSDGYFNLPNNGYNEVMKKMKDGDIYLLATDSQQSITVAVSMFENKDTKKIDNYNRLTESELSDIVVGYQQSSDGTTYSASTVDEVVQDIVWIDFEFRATVDNSVYKQYQANTVVNGKNISVTIQRNGSDVIGSDYDVLKSIVSSVKFTKSGLPKNFLMYIIIGAAVLVIIILIIILIVAKRARRRRKKSKNDKIIKELASKYNTGKSGGQQTTANTPAEKHTAQDDFYAGTDDADLSEGNMAKTMHFDMHKARKAAEQTPSRQISEPKPRSESYYYDDDDDDYSRPVKSYTDEEIARLLGDTEDDENFIEPLSETEADFEAYSEEESAENSPEFTDVPDEDEVADEEITLEKDLAEHEAQKPLKSVREVFDFSKFMQNARQKAEAEYQEQNEQTQEATKEPEKAEEPEEPKPAEEPAKTEEPEAQEETTEEPTVLTMADFTDSAEEPKEETEEAPEEETEESDGELTEEEIAQMELDDYNNDEVLVREEAKHNKFSSSSDFFEEAPKKIMGVISREEIEDAEEFDVIEEVEQKVSEVEKEPERREVKKQSVLKKTATGFKNFGTHCGYFVKNVRREMKRSKAKKQRAKAEEERRQRAKQRAERQKIQTQNGGLVQVKAKGQRRPDSNRRG